MANRVAVGAVTIQDVKDGIHPISMVLSNQSHTFAADQNGAVSTAERDLFSCEVMVYVGQTRAIYDNTNPYSDNTYRVGAITYSGSGWSVTNNIESNQSVLRVSAVPTGTTNKSQIVTIPITVVNSVGSETTFDAHITLSKIIEGADGAVINLTPTRQTIRFNENDVALDTGDITIDVATKGNVGALSAFKSINGGAFSTLSVGAGADSAKSIDIDGSGDNDKLVISTDNFSDSETFTVKVTGATGGSDVVSIVKIQDGKTGNASLTVAISSSTGGFSFKNNTGTTKTLTATVYDNKDGSEISGAGVSYQWKKNGVDVGTDSATFNVSASDVTDGGSEEYSCVVTVAE